MNRFALIMIPVGYALMYWAENILIQSYKRNGTMNVPTLPMCLGIPGSAATPTAAGTPGGPGPNVPGTTQNPGAVGPDGTTYQQQFNANQAARANPNATSLPYSPLSFNPAVNILNPGQLQ